MGCCPDSWWGFGGGQLTSLCVCGPGSALTNGLWLRGHSDRMFMASGALWTVVQDSWKSLGEAGVEQLGMPRGGLTGVVRALEGVTGGGEGPGRGDRAQLWIFEPLRRAQAAQVPTYVDRREAASEPI